MPKPYLEARSYIEVNLKNVLEESESESESDYDYEQLSPLPSKKDESLLLPSTLYEEPINEQKNDKKSDVDIPRQEISVSSVAKILVLSTISGAITGYVAVMTTIIGIRTHNYNGYMCDFYNNNSTDYGCNFTWPKYQTNCFGTSSLTCSFQNQSDAVNHAASDYAEPLAEKTVNPVMVPALVVGIITGGIFGFFAGVKCLHKKKINENSNAMEEVKKYSLTS